MNIKKIAYGCLSLGLVLLISGSFSSFLTGLENDKSETLKRMEVVSDEFESFSTNTSVFEQYRESLYEEVLEGVLCDQLLLYDEPVKNRLSNYEKLVDELKDSTVKLDELCDDVYYPDSATNSKCSNYKSIYEQVVNYFVTDIKNYNDNIKQCNKVNTSLMKSYKTKKKYIDYNNDKKYDGK